MSSTEDDQSAFSMTVDTAAHGQRFDCFVANSLEGVSRTLAAELISQGQIRLNHHLKKPAFRIQEGDLVSGKIPPPPTVNFLPEKIDLDILYEDDQLIVINKQAGLVVHPAPGNWTGTLVNALLYHFPDMEKETGDSRPGIVHRLDRDTSGVMVIAKTRSAHFFLAEAFKERKVKKIYQGLVYGAARQESGIIEEPIGRHPVNRKKMAVRTDGRTAITLWKVLELFSSVSLMEFQIKTGRTHQIRVHSLFMNHPLVGDPTYTGNAKNFILSMENSLRCLFKAANRQMLHAAHLEFRHPSTNHLLSFTAPVPSDMATLISAARSSNLSKI